MNIRVIKQYVDKHTLEMIDVGKVLKDVPEERAKELIAEGVAEKATASVKKPEAKQAAPKQVKKK